MVGSKGCDISSWDVSSYKAAATTSLHPELEACVQFVAMQSSPLVQYSIKSPLKVKFRTHFPLVKLSNLPCCCLPHMAVFLNLWTKLWKQPMNYLKVRWPCSWGLRNTLSGNKIFSVKRLKLHWRTRLLALSFMLFFLHVIDMLLLLWITTLFVPI